MRSVHQNCTFRSHINQDLFSVITTNGKSADCARLLTHHIQFVRGDAATIFKCELGECVMYTGLHNQNYISGKLLTPVIQSFILANIYT